MDRTKAVSESHGLLWNGGLLLTAAGLGFGSYDLMGRVVQSAHTVLNIAVGSQVGTACLLGMKLLEKDASLNHVVEECRKEREKAQWDLSCEKAQAQQLAHEAANKRIEQVTRDHKRVLAQQDERYGLLEADLKSKSSELLQLIETHAKEIKQLKADHQKQAGMLSNESNGLRSNLSTKAHELDLLKERHIEQLARLESTHQQRIKQLEQKQMTLEFGQQMARQQLTKGQQEYLGQVGQLKLTHEVQVNELNNQTEELRTQLSSKESELKSLEKAKAESEERLKGDYTRQIDEQKLELEKLQTNLSSKESELQNLQEAKREGEERLKGDYTRQIDEQKLELEKLGKENKQSQNNYVGQICQLNDWVANLKSQIEQLKSNAPAENSQRDQIIEADQLKQFQAKELEWNQAKEQEVRQLKDEYQRQIDELDDKLKESQEKLLKQKESDQMICVNPPMPPTPPVNRLVIRPDLLGSPVRSPGRKPATPGEKIPRLQNHKSLLAEIVQGTPLKTRMNEPTSSWKAGDKDLSDPTEMGALLHSALSSKFSKVLKDEEGLSEGAMTFTELTDTLSWEKVVSVKGESVEVPSAVIDYMEGMRVSDARRLMEWVNRRKAKQEPMQEIYQYIVNVMIVLYRERQKQIEKELSRSIEEFGTPNPDSINSNNVGSLFPSDVLDTF